MTSMNTRKAASAKLQRRVVAATTTIALVGAAAPASVLGPLTAQVALADVAVAEAVALDGSVGQSIAAGGLYQCVRVTMNSNAQASLLSGDTERVHVVANGDVSHEPTEVQAKPKAGYALGEAAIRGSVEPFGFSGDSMDIERVASFVGAPESYSVIYSGEAALTRADAQGYATKANTSFGNMNKELHYAGATFVSASGFDIDEQAKTITPCPKMGYRANPDDAIAYETSRSVTIEFTPALTDWEGNVHQQGAVIEGMDSLFYGDLNKVVPPMVRVTVGSDGKTVTAEVTSDKVAFANPADAVVDFSGVTTSTKLWRLLSVAPGGGSILPEGWVDLSGGQQPGEWVYYEQGEIVTNRWVMDGGSWYYLDGQGHMATSWKLVDGSWYLFGASGRMKTGWQLRGDDWYLFGTDGAMRTGWQLVDGEWYYLSSGGVMATGWVHDGSAWYYLSEVAGGPLGSMLHDCVTPDGYTLRADGSWDPSVPRIDPLPHFDGAWEVFADNGSSLTRNEEAAFNEATAGLMGIRYQPVAVLARQVVSGTNYAVLALGTSSDEGAKQAWYLLSIYEPLEGSCFTTDVKLLDDLLLPVDQVEDREVVGGWTVNAAPTSLAIPQDYQDIWNEAEFLSAHDLVPVALLDTQLVNGLNLRYLCLTAGGSSQDAYVVELHRATDGTVGFVDSREFGFLDSLGSADVVETGSLNESEPLYVTGAGVEIKKAYVSLLGTTPNFCTILANPTPDKQVFDYGKFEVLDADMQPIAFAGTKHEAPGADNTRELTANWGYFWCASTARPGTMAEGDEYYVYYDGDFIFSGEVTLW
jgi:hypothetical protein